MSNFAALKSSSSESLNKLTEELNKVSNPQTNNKNGPDERIWKPTVDKAGNGYAVIRFLPAPTNEDVPFVRVWDHGFQGPTGQWYIEKSLTTIGQKDPVSEYNTMLWNSGIESNKDLVRKYKRRLSFYSNILVVKDSSNPDNEGKVFLYKYGKKIFDKLNDLMNPQFQDETPINPFDLWQGANFKLKIRQVEGYRNYDKSDFDTPAALYDDDAKLEQVWNSEYSLQEFIGADQFKSYDDLKTKLYRVLALGETNTTEEVATAPVVQEAAPASIPTQAVSSEPQLATADSEDDDAMAFFQKLAQ
jgi:hypothetical protein